VVVYSKVESCNGGTWLESKRIALMELQKDPVFVLLFSLSCSQKNQEANKKLSCAQTKQKGAMQSKFITGNA